MKNIRQLISFAAVLAGLVGPISATTVSAAGTPPRLRVLFLGDDGHHKPADRFKQLEPVLAGRRIELDYTESLYSLNPAKLAGYDCLLIYANHTRISPAQEKAMLDFVASGGGLAALHCASYCFLNSPKYIELVGAQFQTHGTGVFKETIVNSEHPIMKDLSAIESWDETYVHTNHNTNRVVLAERRDGDHAEPYTWVRESGKGRVFYTAWGHDERTWSNPGFLALVERGIRWVSANSPTQLRAHQGLAPFEYTESPVALPNYLPGAQWGTQGAPIRTMQKPLSPEESMKHLVTLPDFEVSLFAAEPDIAKPISMTWDARGRLWIAETVDYPNNMQPEGEGHDRIKICEDTDGDGRADKFTVFADKLSVPTSLALVNGGVVVVHSGKTEFLKDTHGEDKADYRQDLFKGWGTGDTHAGPSNLRYGFDNWIWGTVGYSGFDGTVGGKHRRFGQGIYRFKPDGSALEFIRSSNNNTWGLGLSEDDIVFGSTANGNASMYLPIPNRYYEAVNGWSSSRLETIADSQQFYPITDKVRQVDWHGKYTAGAGGALYTARNFPREFWNRAQFVAEPTGHLLGLFLMEARGADFTAHNNRSFLASDDEWTAPIAAEVGPDGALWVIDWYNYIIQHNPTPQGFRTGKGNAYDTPLRDKIHGRIYRIVYKKARPTPPMRLDTATAEQWVAALKNDNMLWRMTAQRLLVERGKTDVTPALCELVRDRGMDEIGLNPAAIHALWTLKGLGELESGEGPATAAAKAALTHPSAGVRRAAVTVLPRIEASLDEIIAVNLLKDPDAQVRLATLLALSEMPASDGAGAAIQAMLQEPRNAQDRWIPDAATSAAARHDSGFLKAVLSSAQPATPEAANAPKHNLLRNASFESESDGTPQGWRTVTHGGRGDFALAQTGHTGGRSVSISSERGADASWSQTVPVKPHTDYRLTGWIKTENVRPAAGPMLGALLNVHELQDPKNGATRALKGDNDWTEVEMHFNSGDLAEVTINCLLGGWGRARGTAWYDDIDLEEGSGSLVPGETGQVVRRVMAHYAARGPVESIVATLTALKGSPASVATPVLEGLLSGWPADKAPAVSETEKQTLSDLMRGLPESARGRLAMLAQRWGQGALFADAIAAITDSIKHQIADASRANDERVSAAKQLIGLDDQPESVEFVLQHVDLLTPPGLAVGFIGALSQSRNPRTGSTLVAHWARLTPAARRVEITTLLHRPEWANALLDAIENGGVGRGDVATEQWSQLKLNPDKAIAERAGKLSGAGGVISADRVEIVQKLLPLAKESGDPARGKEVFTANCAVCHTFNGQGGKVGPELTGVGARDRSEILIDILDPNRSVEANYRMWNVTTKDGETYSGRLETETQTTVEILDTASQKHVIQRNDIQKLEGTMLSIMPNGFEALPPNDLKSLLAFLTQRHE